MGAREERWGQERREEGKRGGIGASTKAIGKLVDIIGVVVGMK